jgi:hypothetical protein
MDLPPDIVFDPANPPAELPDLPDGYVWGIAITAEAEVVKAADVKES